MTRGIPQPKLPTRYLDGMLTASKQRTVARTLGWPHTSVRNVIEQLNNDVVDDHIRNKVFNNRGITTRAIGEGGKQEHELAARYREMSDALGAKWPRTTKLLRNLADTYEDHAKSSDI